MKRIKRLFRSRRFRKKFIKSVIAIVSLMLCAVILDAVLIYSKNITGIYNTEISVALPEKIYVANEAIVEWVDREVTAKSIYDKYREYGRLDYTNSITFSYSIDNLPVNCAMESQAIAIYDKDYSKEVYSQILPVEERSVNLENLRPNTTYEYFIQVVFENGEMVEKNGEFTTEPSPCFLYVDGTRNVRDIGATETVDGKQIKKYMIYRGTELDGAVESRYLLSQSGQEYMLNTLQIKSDIDLRWYDSNNMKNSLGANVVHEYYPIVAYKDFFNTPYSVENTRKIFSMLANPDTYPIYIHCTYGTDRTGTIIYLLGALLGVDEDTLYREWETSMFCLGNLPYDEMNSFIWRFKSINGYTTQEKAENYLLSIGVTQEEINSIKEILLTD